LTLRDEVKDASRCMVNLKFDQDLVEAVDNAVELGFDMPGPHMSNRALQMLSDKIVK
jgi:predicted fused transcriptional regulator/phosphomethylpyrimidine kinase